MSETKELMTFVLHHKKLTLTLQIKLTFLIAHLRFILCKNANSLSLYSLMVTQKIERCGYVIQHVAKKWHK